MIRVVCFLMFMISTNLFAVHYKFNYDQAGNRDGRIMFDITGKESAPVAMILNHEVKVFPNPAIDNLNVQISALTEENPATVELFDVHGNSIYKNETSTGDLALGISANSNGFYILSITIEDERIEYKIIKQQ